MILYSKEPINVQMKNVMMLDDPSTGGVIYISKSTYDDCMLLAGRFDGDANALIKVLFDPAEVKDNVDLKAAFKTMKNAPYPVQMLGPFLYFCKDNDGLSLEGATIERLYGIIHMLSQAISFNMLTLVPKEVRTKVSIPTSILNSYKKSWEDLTHSIKNDVVLVQAGSRQAIQQVTSTVEEKPKSVNKTKVVKEQEVIEPEEEDEDEDSGNTISEDFFANAFADVTSLTSKKEEQQPATPIQETTSSEPSNFVVNGSADKLDEYDNI